MPDYVTPGMSNCLLGYLIAGVVGVALCRRPRLGPRRRSRGHGAARPDPRRAVRASPSRMTGACPCCQADIPASAARTEAGEALAGAQDRGFDRPRHHRRSRERGARGPPGTACSASTRASKLLTLVLFAVTASLVHSIWMLLALVGVDPGARRRLPRERGRRSRGRCGCPPGCSPCSSPCLRRYRWFTPGAAVVPLGPFTVTQPGLLGVVTLVTRVAAAAAGFALLVIWTMRWSDLLHASRPAHA